MPQTTLSLAKTTQPTLSLVLDRERLNTRIEDLLGRGAVWVCGPAGAGKSTLVAGFLQARGYAVLWYHVDSADNDVATFFHYLRQSAGKQTRGAQVAITQLPQVSDDDWQAFGRRFFRAVFECFARPLVIVLDNYESLPATSPLHRVLAACLEEAPPGSGVIIAGRDLPPAPFARARANGRLGLITGDELRLSDAECAHLAKLRASAVSDDTLVRIQQATAGWVTGAILMLEQAKRTPHHDVDRSAPGSVLFDYIAEEIFTGFDAAVRDFLLRVCWTKRLSVRLAEQLSGDSSARQLLINLARNNYFISERDDAKDREYVLHPLLRDFLKARARESVDQRTVSRQRQRASELLIEDGQVEEGIELLVAELAWERIEPVIIAHAPLLLDQGRSALLASWLNELPHDRLHASPNLLYWYGAARARHAPREARQYFELAYRGFHREPGGANASRARCGCGIIETIIAEADDFSLLDTWIGSLSGLLLAEPQLAGDEFGARFCSAMLVALVLREPAHRDIDDWFGRAEQAVRHSGPRPEPDLVLTLATAEVMAGRFESARQRMRTFSEIESATPAQRGRAQLLAVLAMLFGGDPAAAETSAVNLLHCGGTGMENALSMWTTAAAAAIALMVEDRDRARARVAAFTAAAERGGRLARCVGGYLEAWEALLSDDLITAHHALGNALRLAIELGVPLLEILSRTALAQLSFLCEDRRGGAAQLRRVHSLVRGVSNPLLEIMALLTYGEVALREGRYASGTNALRYALGLGRKQACYYLPWWHRRLLADVAVLALRNNIETTYVRNLIATRGLLPDEPPLDLPDWPWPRRIQTFGRLAIQCGSDAEAVVPGRSRPIQLLRILAALGGRQVPAEQVAAIMWPHVDAEYANKSLTINLHRLRKELGSDDAVQLRDGRLALNTATIWVDVWALERIVATIGDALRIGGRPPGRPLMESLLEQLFAIYQGPFFGTDDELACVSAARRLHRESFVKALVLLTEALPDDAGHQRAVEIFERAIQRDGACESLYRRLMFLLRDSRRLDDAIDVFHRCRVALAGGPQSAPGEETQALYRSLCISGDTLPNAIELRNVSPE